MDIEVKEIIDAFELKAEFFLTSNSLRKVWSRCFTPESYRVSVDYFIQGFESTIGHEVVSSRSNPEVDLKLKDALSTLFKAKISPENGEMRYHIENMVNLTDYVELGTLLRLF